MNINYGKNTISEPQKSTCTTTIDGGIVKNIARTPPHALQIEWSITYMGFIRTRQRGVSVRFTRGLHEGDIGRGIEDRPPPLQLPDFPPEIALWLKGVHHRTSLFEN